MASSTTMPMTSTSPKSVRLFSEKPISFMTANVPTSETTTSIIGRIIAFQSWRNRRTTAATSNTAMMSVRKTSLIDWRTKGVVS